MYSINRNYSQLNPSYRVTERESRAIRHLRIEMRMSVNHIAQTLGRSTKTVQAYTNFYNEERIRQGLPSIDNRYNPPRSRSLGVINFKSKVDRIRAGIIIFFAGLSDTLEEALKMKGELLRAAMSFLISKNSNEEEEAEPH